MQDELVRQAQQGDAEAFDCLARMVGDRCLAIAVRILRDIDLAEDAVQAAYHGLHRASSRNPSKGPMRGGPPDRPRARYGCRM